MERKKNVLVCIDKFKGTLTQKDAIETIRNHLKDKANVEHVSVSDGGEGFLETI